MTSFFRPGPASAIYERVRESRFYSDTRALVEELWARYEPFCTDPNFTKNAMGSAAKDKFNAFTWQMYLACVLMDNGHVLEPSGDDSPDIKVRQRNGSPLWIEVTTAEPGEGENSARPIYQNASGSGGFTINEDKQILRYQNAIREKIKHRDRFIARGAIAPSDPYVIAVNAGAIDGANLDDGLSNIVRAVYPIGPMQYHYKVRLDYSDVDPEEPFDHEGRWTRPYTPTVKLSRGRNASTEMFSDGSASGVSAVIFSPHRIWNAPVPRGRECRTVYNATAASPLAPDTFMFGRSWHGDGEKLYPVDWWLRREISVAAYYRWLARGGPHASEGALGDWLEAEREVIARERL